MYIGVSKDMSENYEDGWSDCFHELRQQMFELLSESGFAP